MIYYCILRYVKTACQVASSSSLEKEDRTFHMTEVLKISQSTGMIVYYQTLYHYLYFLLIYYFGIINCQLINNTCHVQLFSHLATL